MFILVKPEKNKKGIVIFNHKEVLKNADFRLLYVLKNRWHIGFNNGGFLPTKKQKNLKAHDYFIDFYISAYPIINHSKNIPFCGSSFINSEFSVRNKIVKELVSEIKIKEIRDYIYSLGKNDAIRRVIDIVVLSRHTSGKNVDSFIKFLFSIKDKLGINILIYSYAPQPIDDKLKNMIDELNKKPNIFIKIYFEYKPELVLTEKEVINLLNMSKFSYNNNTAEGNCRMIQESMLCGCVPIINRGMQGGLKNHYFDWNTVDFNNVNRELDKRQNIMQIYKNFNAEKIANYAKENFNEKYTIPKFTDCINKLFNDTFKFFDLENLAKKLPSHRKQEIFARYFSSKATSFEFFDTPLILKALSII